MVDRYSNIKKVLKDFDKVQGKTATIVGLQGIGIVVAELLARNGFNLRIIDKGRVYLEELPTQTVYLEEDVTKFKAKQAKKRLEEINKEVKIKAFHEELTEDTEYLLDSDIVIECTSNKESSDVVHSYCLKNEIPVIYAHTYKDVSYIIIENKEENYKDVKTYDIKKDGLLANSVFITAGYVFTLVTKILSGEKVNKSYKIDASNLK